MTDELWKKAAGYQPYEISSHGRIRRPGGFVDALGRKMPARTINSHLLKTGARAYRKCRGPYVTLVTSGKQKSILVSELVAKTFVDDSYDNRVNTLIFRDHNPANCKADNIIVVPITAAN